MQLSRRSKKPPSSRMWAPVLPCLLAIGATVSLAHEVKVKSLAIEHPWIRATAKDASVTAAYMIIKNVGSQPDRLISASLKGAAAAEIHETKIEDGIAKMRSLPDGVTIAPGETINLIPGGKHVMFTRLTKQFDADDYIDGTLTFEKAGKIDVDFFVEGSGKDAAHSDKRGHGPPEHDGHH